MTSVCIIIIILREFVCVCVCSESRRHTAIRLRLGNEKTFFPHTRWPTNKDIYTPDWECKPFDTFYDDSKIEIFLLFCFLLPGEKKFRRKYDFSGIKDGGSSRWRIAFQPISSLLNFVFQLFVLDEMNLQDNQHTEETTMKQIHDTLFL